MKNFKKLDNDTLETLAGGDRGASILAGVYFGALTGLYVGGFGGAVVGGIVGGVAGVILTSFE